MTQTIQQAQEQDREKKKTSKFDNVFLDMVYNVIAWLPATIISWVISNLDLE